MSHLAVAEQLDGKVVTWMGQVSDAQYGASPAPVTQAAPAARGPDPR